MTVNTAYKQYRDNSIFTSTPEELTLMLYNGLIKFIRRGISDINENNIEGAHNNIIRAQDIVEHFQTTLDKKYEISKSLEVMYDYMYRRLIEANLTKDVDILNEVLGYARELRDTWGEAMKIAKKQNRDAHR